MNLEDILDPEDYKALQWGINKSRDLKVGDFVTVSGTLTGYGDLKGYITDIGRFVSVRYDAESRIIANGEKGKVGLPHFFTKNDE
jgi:hypothetical protein